MPGQAPPGYRFTSLIMPAFLLVMIPAFAAYPFDAPVGGGLTLPFLTLLSILFIAFRYPGLLPSPLVFISGLACDLFTGAPIGFWSLLFLLALAGARLLGSLSRGRTLAVAAGFLASSIIAAIAAWGLASLYGQNWQEGWKFTRAMIMAGVLMPLPAMALAAFEDVLIFRGDANEQEGPFSHSARRAISHRKRQEARTWLPGMK